MDTPTIIILASVGISLLLLIGLLLFRRKVVATVAGFSWERTVFLEHYVWVDGSSLDGYPAGSRNQHSTMESYQSYEFVRHEHRTTTDANGNTTTTMEPVYEYVTRWRTRYYYEIQRWVASRQLVASENDRSPHWPSYVLDARTHERVRDKKEKYLVHFQSAKGQQFRRKMPEDAWADFDEKDTYVLKTTLFGQVTRVEPDLELPDPGQRQLVEMPEQIQG